MVPVVVQLIRWIRWPNEDSSRGVHLWAEEFLEHLSKMHKHELMFEIASATVKDLSNLLVLKYCKRNALHALTVMLLRCCHTPELFHQICPLAPGMIIFNRNDPEFVGFLAMFYHLQMNKHPGFPELYAPIAKELKDLPKPDEQTLRSALASHPSLAGGAGGRACK